ncbi:MAG: tRNA (adenosine(37)-N6)-threonylcarbamoyltransferase complex dimerization subunit type 1 TsaB [Lachnospiraceae bacterium]|nr:tRNA (adenosine(37)-N6)-threonylcarbamoyltransferase complex dimerization subunit type 1 TsaB [Lachnospiraceae bacterium]
MKILAIDASGLVASVSILEDDKMVGEYTLNHTRNHSVTLLPLVDALIQATDSKPEDFDYIALAGGPGSFTGLRIGAATAKGLAFSWKKPIISVPTIDALCYNVFGVEGIVCPILDARRNQTYTGIYRFEEKDGESTLLTIDEQKACDINSLIERLNELGEKVTFLGDGVPVFKDTIDEKLKVEHRYAPAHQSRQRASSVGMLAFRYAKEGKIEDTFTHRPIYLRETQAERERKMREGK